MTAATGRTVLRGAGTTDVGKVRSNNQDQFMLRPDAQLWVVADGMGGHRGGEVASQLACEEMARSYREHTVEGLVHAVAAANRAVHDAGQADPDLRGMGTTMVALAVVQGDDVDEASGEVAGSEVLAIANVGDSRVYRLTLGELEQLTEDHSLVADMVREGSLSPDEAESHPQKNILTRVLGVTEDIPIDIVTVTPRDGDRYLLCSDGLFNEVSDDDITSVLRRLKRPEEAADELVGQALAGGARDNTTVVVVDVVDDGRATSRAAAAAPATAPIAPIPVDVDVPTTTQEDEDEATRSGAYSDPEENGRSTRRARRRARQEEETEEEADEGGARHARRRRKARDDEGGDRPRRFTWRVGLFVLLVLAVFGGAFATIQWYGKGAYYVGFDGDDVAIFQGRPDGVLWIQPEVVDDDTTLNRDTVPALYRDRVEAGQEYGSREAAEDFVSEMEALAQQADAEGEGNQQADDGQTGQGGQPGQQPEGGEAGTGGQQGGERQPNQTTTATTNSGP